MIKIADKNFNQVTSVIIHNIKSNSFRLVLKLDHVPENPVTSNKGYW